MRSNDFKKAITDELCDIISTFDLHLEDMTKQWLQLNLYNDKCIIRFINDFGIIEVSFVNPIEKQEKEKIKRLDGFSIGYPTYPIFSVWEFLFPSDKENYRVESWDMTNQLTAIKRLLGERLSDIIKGDFSWTNLYKKRNDCR